MKAGSDRTTLPLMLTALLVLWSTLAMVGLIWPDPGGIEQREKLRVACEVHGCTRAEEARVAVKLGCENAEDRLWALPGPKG